MWKESEKIACYVCVTAVIVTAIIAGAILLDNKIGMENRYERGTIPGSNYVVWQKVK